MGRRVILFGAIIVLVVGLVLLERNLPRETKFPTQWPDFAEPYNPFIGLNARKQRNKELREPGLHPCRWRFAVYGDGRGTLYHRDRTVPFLLARAPNEDGLRTDVEIDFVLSLGDMVSHGSGPGALVYDWPAFFAETRELRERLPYFPLPGNHEFLGRDLTSATDKRYNSLDAYKRIFQLPDQSGSEAYYSFKYNKCKFIMLATWGERLAPGSRQWEWLEQQLVKAVDMDHVFVCTHEHIYTASRRRDNTGLGADLKALYLRYGITAHLSSHDHLYYRAHHTDGTVWIVTGGGGASMYPIDSEKLAGGDRDHVVEEVARSSYKREEPIEREKQLFAKMSATVLDQVEVLGIRTRNALRDRLNQLRGRLTDIYAAGLSTRDRRWRMDKERQRAFDDIRKMLPLDAHARFQKWLDDLANDRKPLYAATFFGVADRDYIPPHLRPVLLSDLDRDKHVLIFEIDGKQALLKAVSTSTGLVIDSKRLQRMEPEPDGERGEAERR